MQGDHPPAYGARIVVRQGHGCVVTALWFLLVGWWLSALWIAVAWFFVVLIVTMPIGLIMINKLPLIVSLQPETTALTATAEGLRVTTLPQRNLLLRALYFLVIGWWLSLLWMEAAWLVAITLVGLPLAIWMFNRVPAVTTLRRY